MRRLSVCRCFVFLTYDVATPMAFAGSGGGSIVTPLVTSADGDGHSTQRPLKAYVDSVVAHHSTSYVSQMHLLIALGAFVLAVPSPPSTSTTGICRTTPLAAHTGGGGGHSSGESTSTISVVSFTAQEIAQLRYLITASDSSSPDASSLTSSVESLTMLEITRLQCVRPLFTQLGIFPWILDTGAYFHITRDSSSLSSIHPSRFSCSCSYC